MNQQSPSRQPQEHRRGTPPAQHRGGAQQPAVQRPPVQQPPVQQSPSQQPNQPPQTRQQMDQQATRRSRGGQPQSSQPPGQQAPVQQRSTPGRAQGAPPGRQQGGARPGGPGVAPTLPEVQKVEQSENYVHVRFRDPDAFGTIRTPDWTERAARDVAPGAEVRRGRLKNSGEWRVESVLIPKPTDRYTAIRKVERIVRKVED